MAIHQGTPQIRPKYRSDIDGLRAIGVLSVVFFHAFPNLLRGGFIGVDIFFVISGYLISKIIFENLLNLSFSFSDFYAHRVRRIFPSLLIVLTTTFSVGWVTFSAGEFSQLGKHIAGGAGFISNLLLLNESGYFDVGGEFKPLLNLWSLGIEEQFYIFWPLILALTWRFRCKFIYVVLLALISSFLLNLHLSGSNPVANFYLPFSRFWELLVGALAVLLSRNAIFQKFKFKNSLSVLGVVFIVSAEIFIVSESNFPGWWALLPAIGTALILLSEPVGWINSRILSCRLLVWIGLISYPLYLWHWPIFVFWRTWFPYDMHILTTLFLIALSLLFGWISYQFVEKPIRSKGGMKTVVFLSILMLGVGYVGYNTYSRGGLPSRKVAQESNAIDRLLQNPAVPNCSVGEPAHPNEKLPPGCSSDNLKNKGVVSVFLWGDSHVANFSYGFTEARIKEYDINLRYALKGACPPVLNYTPQETIPCIEFNEFAFSEIAKFHPDTVVLLADWVIYGERGKTNLSDEKLVLTIDRLKSLGVKKIILFGNYPDFEVNQARLGLKLFQPQVVDRTYKRFNFSTIKVDRHMAEIAYLSQINFISPINLLCNTEGCLLSASRNEFIPMAYDKTHFTYAGSDFFMENFIDKNFFR